MSRIADHQERRNHIADATLRVIYEQGMKGASVRNIARESGISLGALRHYFSTQRELLDFAMQQVKQRVSDRIRSWMTQEMPPILKVWHVLLEVLPVDANRRMEMEVWLSFVVHSREQADSAMQSDGIYQLIEYVMAYMKQSGLLKPQLDLEMEQMRLYVFVDGIALRAYLDPDRLKADQLPKLLAYHLRSICRTEVAERLTEKLVNDL